MVIDIGSASPTFELPVVGEERTASLDSALQSGPAVLSIYKTSCRASKAVFPFLERLAQSYPTDRLSVWGVSLDSPNVTASFGRRYSLSFPNLVDDEGYPTAQAYGVDETPSTILIDQAGSVVWRSIAFSKAEMDELSREVARLLGEPVADITSETDDVPDSMPG